MRHAIVVVGCQAQRADPLPVVRMRDDESLHMATWFACKNQEDPAVLLDDTRSVFLRVLRAPILAYQFYLLVHSTKLWSGKRPLILVRGRSAASRIAAYAGTWGGGDVVKVDTTDAEPLGPTRFLVDSEGNLKLRAD